MQQASGLTNIQLELLKLFSFNISDKQLQDIKQLLVQYFAKEIDDEMDKLWEENEWDQSTIETWKKTHMRTSYKSDKQ